MFPAIYRRVADRLPLCCVLVTQGGESPRPAVRSTRQGGPVSFWTTGLWRPAIKSVSGLPRQRFHDLRHAAASFMLAEGVPVMVARDALGHRAIAVAADI